MTYHILFNPLAGNGKGEERAKRLETLLTDGARCYHDLTKLNGYAPLLRTLEPQDVLVLTGGDGTINRFLNEADYDAFENEILYYATGSGNDFLHDLDKPADAAPFSLRPYLKNLPSVTVNGQTRTFRRVWLAPTMHGRFCGGGMMVTPDQRRNNPAGTVSTCVLYGSGKLKTLLVFPSIFKGEHVKHEEMVQILTGHEITVRFDRPTALQIDGETILGVTEYSVRAGVPAAVV